MLLFFQFLLGSAILALSSADFPVPPCYGTDIDGSPCGEYQYDAIWNISLQSTSAGAEYMTVNDAWPPPTINVSVNSRIRIQVYNQVPEDSYDRIGPITLHFHGILQANGYNVMDGPQGLTQSGIQPNQSFIYDFPARNAGTFWVHTHSPGQYPKGIRSPLIVTDSSDYTKLDYAAEHVVTVSDWWNNFSATEAIYDAGSCHTGLEPPLTKIIVNDVVEEWNRPKTIDNSQIYIPPGTKARIRFINMSAFAYYYVWITGIDAKTQLEVEIVELDGVLVQKLPGAVTQTGFYLASGQRLSIILNRTNDIANETPLRVYFLSDPRISGGHYEISTCPPFEPNIQGTNVQYGYTLITSISGQDVTNYSPPVEDFDDADSTGAIIPHRRLTNWTNEEHSNPYFSSRPKLPMEYDDRGLDHGGNPPSGTVWIPKSVFGFTDVYFTARDNEAEWADPVAIHRIQITDYNNLVSGGSASQNGKAVMGWVDNSALPTQAPHLFSSPESQSDQGWNRDMPTLLNLLEEYFSPFDSTYSNPADYFDGGGGTQTIIFPNDGEVHWFDIRTTKGDHPIHMHGHEFQIIARLPATFGAAFGTLVNTDGSDGPGPALDNPDDEKLKGQVNSMRVAYAALNNNQPFSPVRRDTIMIERGWDYIIAVKANNPGVWALHCHNDFHASTGMFMQIIEQPTLIRSTFTRWVAQTIQPTTAQCPNPITMDLSTQGNFSDGWNNFQNNRSIDVPWPAMEQLYRTTMEWQGKGDVCWEYNDF